MIEIKYVSIVRNDPDPTLVGDENFPEDVHNVQTFSV